jgi:hypothetical protein
MVAGVEGRVPIHGTCYSSSRSQHASTNSGRVISEGEPKAPGRWGIEADLPADVRHSFRCNHAIRAGFPDLWVSWTNRRAICRAKPPRCSGCDACEPLEMPLESMSSSHIARLLAGGCKFESYPLRLFRCEMLWHDLWHRSHHHWGKLLHNSA